MQPDPSKLTPKDTPKEFTDYGQTRQYGLNTQNEHGSSYLHSGAILGEASRPTITGSAAITAANHGDGDGPPQWMSPTSAPRHDKEFPIDRISEHENALAYTPRKRNEGPRFLITPGNMAKPRGKITITDLPNGMINELRAYGQH